MNVNKVTAVIRYSQDTGKGAWKSLELGIEASISEREDWQEAQAVLYGQLARQFKTLWSQNGTTPAKEVLEGQQVNEERSIPQDNNGQPPPEHFCREHGVPFKARKGQYGEFYSHQIKGTREWCNEAKGKEARV
jgi:hypothetical protein